MGCRIKRWEPSLHEHDHSAYPLYVVLFEVLELNKRNGSGFLNPQEPQKLSDKAFLPHRIHEDRELALGKAELAD